MSSGYSLILATDLDGTFLGGSDGDRAEFYDYLQRHRDRVLLVFVTGRDLDLVRQLYDEAGFPTPDYIIGDVGTSVTCGKTFQPLAEVQGWISDIWQNANDLVKALLNGEPGLSLQPIEPRYRVSYYYDPEVLQPSTLKKLDEAGFDAVLSADRFLDVMPKGVSKGPTLLKTLAALNLDLNNAVVAGDTLNDLSLFETGLKGVAVGNAEPKLIDRLRDMSNVYLSQKPGAAGIWEGLNYHSKTLS
ncbi:MAG: HAD-IIB family hydrolase [Cyanobacteria bacterium SID2]|nr:HAD-IIB family hydrolase [Cyanobacteria bacterium SID2]MBP0006329.1 HAD-IIB family hydrolase [Cyanobacteria bacterium SBC]